ncbi:MAG: DMT family transporter [Gammaproteobacteria bacterium]|nr:DMT family transporter [Gammaproteobacteria bacterium]
MDAHIIALVLLAAFFHAVWNASVKRGDDKLRVITGIQAASILLVLPLVPFVGLPHADSWPYIALSAALHFGYYLSLAAAYRYGDFAQAYPVARGSAPIMVALWGVLVLREALSGGQWLSLALVIGGIMIFATRRLGGVLQHRKALWCALLTAAFIAAYTVTDGVGGRLSGNVAAYMVYLTLTDSALVVLYAAHRERAAAWREMAAEWRLSLAGGALALSAYWLVVWSMSQTSIALVSALRETSVIIAALIGAYYFKEPAGKRRIVASIVIFAGIALLGWSES